MKQCKFRPRSLIAVSSVLIAAFSYSVRPTYAQSPFVLVVDTEGTVDIKNVSTQAREVHAYRITSLTGAITPDSWNSIYSQYQRDPLALEEVFGPTFPKTGIAFAEFGPGTSTFVGEALPLIDWSVGLRVPIGKPFGSNVSVIRSLVEQGDLDFAIDIGIDFTTNLPILFEIPEPSTLMLLLMAAPLLQAGFVRFRLTRTIHP